MSQLNLPAPGMAWTLADEKLALQIIDEDIAYVREELIPICTWRGILEGRAIGICTFDPRKMQRVAEVGLLTARRHDLDWLESKCQEVIKRTKRVEEIRWRFVFSYVQLRETATTMLGSRTRITVEELMQEGRIELYHAACSYEPKPGYQFTDYATPIVHAAIREAITAAETVVLGDERIQSNSAGVVSPHDEAMIQAEEEQQERQLFVALLNEPTPRIRTIKDSSRYDLSEDELLVIQEVFGLTTRARTCKDLALEYGVSEAEVIAIRDAALARLKRKARVVSSAWIMKRLGPPRSASKVS